MGHSISLLLQTQKIRIYHFFNSHIGSWGGGGWDSGFEVASVRCNAVINAYTVWLCIHKVDTTYSIKPCCISKIRNNRLCV